MPASWPRAFFQEEHAEESRKLLSTGEELWVPDLIHCELANVIWKAPNAAERSTPLKPRICWRIFSACLCGSCHRSFDRCRSAAGDPEPPHRL